MPFMDPAFATAVCRYDLSDGPLKLIAPVSQAYTSVTFYTRNSVAYYAINDRAAGRRAIELDLMTPEQHAELPEEEDVTAADRLIIESPTATRPDRVAGAGAGARPDADGAPGARRRAPAASSRLPPQRFSDYFGRRGLSRNGGRPAQRRPAAAQMPAARRSTWFAAMLLLQLRQQHGRPRPPTGSGSATARCSSAKR